MRRHVVLVVDDEPSIRLLCRVNLELDGYEVREAGTLDDGARAARARRTSTSSLLDMHLGNERGDALSPRLRARAADPGRGRHRLGRAHGLGR